MEAGKVMVKIVLPSLGEEVKNAVVSYWHCHAGDVVKEGDDIVEMATDKAAFNVPSTAAGKVKELYFQEGDTVQVGEALLAIE